MTYKELLKKGKEFIADAMIPYDVAKEKNALEAIIIEVQGSIVQSDLTIQEEKSKKPINWNKLIDAMDAKNLAERKLGQLKDLQKELFD